MGVTVSEHLITTFLEDLNALYTSLNLVHSPLAFLVYKYFLTYFLMIQLLKCPVVSSS